MLYLALLLSVLAQVAAALVALRQVGKAGRYGLAWGCISLALVIMVQRRVQSLMEYSDSQPPDTEFTLVGLAISLLMLGGLWGLRLLFAELRRQEAALQTLAATDELTGLANRRSMVQRIQHELERGERNPRPTTLLMLDLDHFKGVNDTYGHAAGDGGGAAAGLVADLANHAVVEESGKAQDVAAGGVHDLDGDGAGEIERADVARVLKVVQQALAVHQLHCTNTTHAA